jgi:HEAT repeat protein
MLRDPVADVRCRVVEAVGELGNAQTVAELLPLLNDETPSTLFSNMRVCHYVVVALVKIGTLDAYQVVERWMQTHYLPPFVINQLEQFRGNIS